MFRVYLLIYVCMLIHKYKQVHARDFLCTTKHDMLNNHVNNTLCCSYVANSFFNQKYAGCFSLTPKKKKKRYVSV